MKLTAIGLATALSLTSTMAFAMGGGGGGGGSGGAPGTIVTPNADPVNCGGLVCFTKPQALTASNRPRKRLRHNPAQADRW